MHYLVTGGAGFIGSHLCDTLLGSGHSISVIDDFSTGKRENLDSRVTLVEGDCADISKLMPLVQAADGVFHLAAIASVERSCQQWAATSRTNQFSTITLLEAISKRGGAIPFVYASSAAVYGDPDARFLPLQESTPLVPLTPYGADKLGSELHAHLARHLFGIPTLGLRFFNVYGSRQDPASPYSGVISIFMNLIVRGQSVTLNGDGAQTRDFIHVSDVVSHLIAAMTLLHAGNVPLPAALNVCSADATSILQLAQQIAAICGLPLHHQHGPARVGDIRMSCGNRDLTKQWLGLDLGMSLPQGLSETLTWHQKDQAA